jgi:hypothetical protein
MSLGPKRHYAGFVLLLGLQVLPAWAQFQPQPPPLAREGRRWSFGWTIRPTFTNSLFFSDTGDSSTLQTRADFALAGTTSLGYSRSRGPSRYAARTWASESFFLRGTRLGDPKFGLAAAGERRLGHASRASAQLSLSDGLNLEALYFSQGTLADLDVKSFTGEVRVSHQLGPRTTAGVSLDSMAFRYRASAGFDSGLLPADALLPPEAREPLVPDAGTSDFSWGQDPTLQLLGYLGPEGLRTPRLDYWTWHAGGELQHQLSARSRLAFGTGYRRSETSPSVSAANDQIEAQLAAERTLNAGTTLGVSYAAQLSRYEIHYLTHTVQLRSEKSFSPRFRLSGSIGGSYLDGPDRAQSNWAAIGGAGVSLRLKRTSVSARYEHNRYQGLVTGRSYATDFGFFSLRRPLTRRLTLSAYGYIQATGDSFDERASYRSLLVGASTATRAWKRLLLGASAAYFRFERDELPATTRPIVTLYLTWR